MPILAWRLNSLPAEPFSGHGIIGLTFSFMVLALCKAAFSAKRVNMVYQRRAIALTCKLFDLGGEDFFIWFCTCWSKAISKSLNRNKILTSGTLHLKQLLLHSLANGSIVLVIWFHIYSSKVISNSLDTNTILTSSAGLPNQNHFRFLATSGWC